MKLQLQFAELRLDNPCHEDWDKMLPEERGRFCLSCQKTVLDFTQKTTEEILQFFQHRKLETACVRLNETALKKPVLTDVGINHRRLRRLAWFAYALFIVFGSALFSCNDKSPDTIAQVRQEVFEEPTRDVAKIPSAEEIGDEKKEMKELVLIGDTSITIKESLPDTILLPNVEVNDSALSGPCHRSMGGAVMVYTYHREFIVDDSAKLAQKSFAPVKDELKSQLSVFPNPSDGNFKIQIKLPSAENDFQLSIFNQSGQLIREIAPEENILELTKTIEVNLSNEAAGMYFIRMQTGDTSITKRAIVVH